MNDDRDQFQAAAIATAGGLGFGDYGGTWRGVNAARDARTGRWGRDAEGGEWRVCRVETAGGEVDVQCEKFQKFSTSHFRGAAEIRHVG